MTCPVPSSFEQYHCHFDSSVQWRLTAQGIEIENSGIERTNGEPQTVTRIWESFETEINTYSQEYSVPAELIVATIATESQGDTSAINFEPHYRSDEETPNQVSAGLMQTLISTARETLAARGVSRESITRDWLFDPSHSIQAGTSYIAQQKIKTNYDPILVAAAYNSGGVYENSGASNRFKLRQYPIDTSQHCDRFVKWFNDFWSIIDTLENKPSYTMWETLNSQKQYSLPLESIDSERVITNDSLNSYYDHTEKEFSGGYFPVGANTSWHGGIHLLGEENEPVHASAAGTVVAARMPATDAYAEGINQGSRNFVLIRHTDNEKSWYSLYVHLASVDPASEEGQAITWLNSDDNALANTLSSDSGTIIEINKPIATGDIIGYVGTGITVEGEEAVEKPILHWEIITPEIFSDEWNQVEDPDSDFSCNSDTLIRVIDSDRDSNLSAQEIIDFYKNDENAPNIRSYACKFMTEWGIDWNSFAETMAAEGFSIDPSQMELYNFWDTITGFDSTLPSSGHVWHYNPITFLERLSIRIPRVFVIELPDILFNHRSATPILGEGETLIAAIASTYNFMRLNPEKKLLVAGHTDKSGEEDYNQVLSEKRAESIKAILEADEVPFVDIAIERAVDKDLTDYFDYLSGVKSWRCTDAHSHRERISLFQGEYNERYSRDITVDGICGRQTWGAIFDILYHQLTVQYAELGQGAPNPELNYGFDGSGIFGFGETIPVDSTNMESVSAEDRRVEILIFNEPMENPEDLYDENVIHEPIEITPMTEIPRIYFVDSYEEDRWNEEIDNLYSGEHSIIDPATASDEQIREAIDFLVGDTLEEMKTQVDEIADHLENFDIQAFLNENPYVKQLLEDFSDRIDEFIDETFPRDVQNRFRFSLWILKRFIRNELTNIDDEISIPSIPEFMQNFLYKRFAKRIQRGRRDIQRTFFQMLEAVKYKYDYEQNLFYTTPEAYQQHFGYTDVYDGWANMPPLFRIDYVDVPFVYNGEEKHIRLWKGNYWGAVGGEIGYYTGPNRIADAINREKGNNESGTNCSQQDMLLMGFTLKHKNGDTIFTRYMEHNWWVIGMHPKYFDSYHEAYDELILEGVIDFEDNEPLAIAFEEGIRDLHEGANISSMVSELSTLKFTRHEGNKFRFTYF